MNEKQPLVLNVEECARLLKLSRGAMYQAIRDGSIPSLRIGKRILIPLRALERMLEGNSEGGDKPIS